MSFDQFNLHEQILKVLAESGYTQPTEIQLEAIPKVAAGSDIRASAATGTGKTAAFLLPALNRIVSTEAKDGRGPRVLVLAPTRELAMQIATQSEKYSKYLNRVKTVCISGGVPYDGQLRKLSRPYDVLIATPGRLIDFLHRGKIDFSRLEILILDEADRMLDMGFLEPVEEIVQATPADRQTLLFSATLQGSVLKLSNRLLKDPLNINIKASDANHENIKQKLLYVDDLHHKNRLLDHILNGDELKYGIIFTATKRHANQLVEELQDQGHEAAALHGDMNQRQRTRTIKYLREGKFKILVATDVAARGIDVQAITHVINFDLPRNIEDYVHRIGRTGRAGALGTALSFVSNRDEDVLQKIKKYTGQSIEIITIPGMEPRPRQPGSRPKGDSGRRGGPRSYSSGPKDRRGGFSSGSGERRGGFSSGPGERRGGFSSGPGEKRGGFSSGPGERRGGFSSGPGEKRGGFSSDSKDRRGNFSSGSGERRGGFSSDSKDRGENFSSGPGERRGGFSSDSKDRRGGFSSGSGERRGGFSSDSKDRRGGFSSGPRERTSGSGERTSGSGEKRGGFSSDSKDRRGGFSSGPRERTSGSGERTSGSGEKRGGFSSDSAGPKRSFQPRAKPPQGRGHRPHKAKV